MSEELNYHTVSLRRYPYLRTRELEERIEECRCDGFCALFVRAGNLEFHRDEAAAETRYRVAPFAPPRGPARETFYAAWESAGWKRIGEYRGFCIFEDRTGTAREADAPPVDGVRALRRLRWGCWRGIGGHASVWFILSVLRLLQRDFEGVLLYNSSLIYLLSSVLFFLRAMSGVASDVRLHNRAIRVLRESPESALTIGSESASRRMSRVEIATLVIFGVFFISAIAFPGWLQAEVPPLADPPYVFSTIYGTPPSEDIVKSYGRRESICFPGQWDYRVSSSVDRRNLYVEIYEARWPWAAETLFDALAKDAAPLDEAMLSELSLDAGALKGRTILYREGLRCVKIGSIDEPFEPGSPLYEAVKNRDHRAEPDLSISDTST